MLASQPTLYGVSAPRIAPPLPLIHEADELRAVAHELSLDFMPWQDIAAHYLTARAPDDRALYREVAILVARQQGKTTLVKPVIVRALRQGKRVMHLAQNRELPREMFKLIADWFMDHEPHLFPLRRGRPILPRFGSGQEEIVLNNGAHYRIVAAGRGGARGHSNDLVIIDELRELHDYDVMAAVEPTLTMSLDPQLIYLSNMGEEDSVILNAVRERADSDPMLAYLEWSAPPDLDAGNINGWLQACPAIGHFPGVLEAVQRAYDAAIATNTLPYFETERLCRSVVSLREAIVTQPRWNACQVAALPDPVRPVMGVSIDPQGRRASVVMAWRDTDDKISLTQLYDVPGHPIDVDDLGRDLRAEVRVRGIATVAYGPEDTQLARHFLRSEAVSGVRMANASTRFAELVEAGNLRWHDAQPVGADLEWTTRKPHDAGFIAEAASAERPVTAALAAIRAVWLASKPVQRVIDRVPSVAGF